MHDTWQDLRYGARLLLRNRGFTLAAVLTLALGIGATTAIFSVVDTVLLRPAPFANADRLAVIWETDRNSGTTREPSSWPDVVDFRLQSRQFQEIAGIIAGETTVTRDDGEPSRHAVVRGTHGLFPMLGLRPIAGRSFTEQDDVAGAPTVVMISERLWEREFARSPDAIGGTLRSDGQAYTIIGVMPDDADFGILQILSQAAYSRGYADRDPRSRVDIWVPLQASEETLPRDTHPIIALGRLADGASFAGAQQELAGITARLEQQYQVNDARGANVEPLSEVIFGRVRPALWLMLTATAFVLLIACVNVANLLLVRGTSRLREVAVRTALGAATQRLARQFIAESVILCAVATALGVVLAFGVLKLLVALAPADVPRIGEVGIDMRVLIATLVVALATGLVFGLVPVLQMRRLEVNATLKEEESRGGTAGRSRGFVRSALVVSEVALAVVLVVGAGLLIKSFWRLQHVDAGFNAAGVVKAQFELPGSRYPTDRRNWPDYVEIARFNSDLVQRVSTMPGVQAVAVAGEHPLDAGFTNSFSIVGREDESRNWPEISVRRVSPGYFDVVRLPVATGRTFTDGDDARATPVAVINEMAARLFFVDRNPIGQQLAFWGTPRTIVGVVGDEHFHGLASAVAPAVYAPLLQVPSSAEVLLARTDGSVDMLAGTLRAAVRETDPQLAVFGLEPLSTTVSDSIGQERFTMLLLAVFAALALVLAAIGIHGVLSYTVAQRRHEIGIRMALGAPASRVTRLVIGQGARLVGIGLLIGVALALATTQVMQSLLFGVSVRDITALLAVLPVLAIVGLVATWLPARRAVRTDPLSALRQE
ncbi:MAG TPA: ABC transporter permease [Gemmatimonadaceae bacterium]|nr:ABC transporter permease [Gemmatimonadaceae bacterium]